MAVTTGQVEGITLVKESTGLLLTKLEIIVNFFQVYALMLVLSFHLHFPSPWFDIKALYDWLPNLGAIDFYGIFARVNLRIPDEYAQVGR